MSLNRNRNFAAQSTYFHSDTAVAEVNMYLYVPVKLNKRKAVTLT